MELLTTALRDVRRTTVLWALGIVALIMVTNAFWPLFKDDDSLNQSLEGLPPGLSDALGISDFSTPAGWLNANLFALVVPLLLVFLACSVTNRLTARQEDAGLFELLLSLPLSRPRLFGSNGAAAALVLLLITVVTFLATWLSCEVFGIDQPVPELAATVTSCGLLALVAGAVTYAVAGLTGRPGTASGAGILLAVVAYVVAELFPLSDALEPLSHISFWDWAFGNDPLTNGAQLWRYLALLGLAAVLVAGGIWSFRRRDVRAA